MNNYNTFNACSSDPVKQALRTSEKRFQMLIEQSPIAFFAHDPQGCFLQVNEQTCSQLGYSQKELLNMTAQDIQKGVKPEQAEELWQKALSGGTVVAEDILQRKDGSTLMAEVTIGLFQDGDNIEIFGFFRDISETKKREKEREELITRLQKALDDVKQLSGLVPICAHCHKIRDDEGYWNTLETYIQNRSDVSFSHGICPICLKKVYKQIKQIKKTQG